MDLSTATGRVIVALKQQLKVKGLHYRDVASRLKISERTVKRYFSGRGITLDVLQQLAEIVELDVLSLVVLTQQQSIAFPEMSRTQQAGLRKNVMALAVFYFLNFGMTPAQIAQEFELGRRVDAILAKLENMGLIRRFSANGVKILAGRTFGSRRADQITEQKVGSVRRFLSEIDLGKPDSMWFYQVVRLSHASAMHLDELMRRFVHEATATTKSELNLPAAETRWYRLFVAAEPIARQHMFPKT
jgi:transcriptional regulator with XRE-family HTH domain